MRKVFAALATLAALSLAAGPSAWAQQGFGEESTTTQGNSGKPSPTDNAAESEGTQTTTTTGPKGALKNDKDTPNQETATSGPGKSN